MAKDFYHDNVRQALEKDGWHITHDPYKAKILVYNPYKMKSYNG
jgi:XisH protein